jgi:hypothetical protein
VRLSQGNRNPVGMAAPSDRHDHEPGRIMEEVTVHASTTIVKITTPY